MMWCDEFRCPFWPRPTTSNWISKMKPSGGSFLEKNSHHWDTFNWWAQAPALRIFAQTQNTGSHAAMGDVWDHGWAESERTPDDARFCWITAQSLMPRAG